MNGAEIADGPYRYLLQRELDPLSAHFPVTRPRRLAVVVGLNPSTANGEKDDPTSRNWTFFLARDRCTAYHAVNLYAYRTPEPAALTTAALFAGLDIVGPSNDAYLQDAITGADVVLCAWGSPKSPRPPGFAERVAVVVAAVERARRARPALEVVSLGTNKDGNPRHALYLPHTTGLRPWPPT